MDWSDCPLVESNAEKLSGTPVLVGTRMPADGVVSNFLTGSPVEEIAYNFYLPIDTVEAVLRFALQRVVHEAA